MIPPRAEAPVQIEIGRTMLATVHRQMDQILDTARPSMSHLKIRERVTEQERLQKGIERVQATTRRDHLIIDSTLETVDDNMFGNIRRVRFQGAEETLVIGYTFGRAESDEREEVPQHPATPYYLPEKPYIPLPAITRTLRLHELDELIEIAAAILKNPANISYSFIEKPQADPAVEQ